MAVAFRFGEFQRIHAFSQVPMQERSAFEHAAKLKIRANVISIYRALTLSEI